MYTEHALPFQIVLLELLIESFFFHLGCSTFGQRCYALVSESYKLYTQYSQQLCVFLFFVLCLVFCLKCYTYAQHKTTSPMMQTSMPLSLHSVPPRETPPTSSSAPQLFCLNSSPRLATPSLTHYLQSSAEVPQSLPSILLRTLTHTAT